MRYVLIGALLLCCQTRVTAFEQQTLHTPAGYMRLSTPATTPAPAPAPAPRQPAADFAAVAEPTAAFAPPATVADAAEAASPAPTLPPALDTSPAEAPPAMPEAAPAPTVNADAANTPMELTVEQAVALALQQNPQVEIADADVEAAKAQVGQAKSHRLPQIGTRAAYNYVQGLERDIIDAPIVKDLIKNSGFRPDPGTLTTRLTVQQTLYAGGQVQAAIRASQFLAQSQEWQRQAALQQLVYNTRAACYDVVLTESLVGVAQESIATFAKHLSDSQKLLEGEVGTKFEVLRAETELSARLASLESANTAHELAMLNLHRLLGLPQEQPLTLKGDWDTGTAAPALDELLGAAASQRPELQALDAGLNAAQEQVSMKRGQFKPRAAATSQYQNVDGGGWSMVDGWAFTVGAEWDIYTGGRRKHEVLEAREKVRSLEAQRVDVQRLVDLDVRQAALRIKEASAKMTKEQKTVELAQEASRLASLRFEEGVGIQTEILDAELALTQARTQLVQAKRDRAVAQAALEKAIGSPAPSTE